MDVGWIVAGLTVLGLSAFAFGWIVGQFVYIMFPDDRFDVWDDDDW